MIGRIELTNWKTHADTRINFRKGTNVLIGIMGAGKSSVMDAISFAFFGTFPALKHKRVSLEGIITNRPEEKESAEVKLEFSVGGNDYSVRRIVEKGGGSSALLKKNGSNLQTQPERVNEEIEKILGLNYDTFSRAIYAEQNRLDYMLELRKGDRKKQIDEMLNLDRFAAAEENATSLINNIRNAIADEETMLSGIDLNVTKGQLEKLSEERKKVEEGIRKLDSDRAGKAEVVEGKRKEMEGYRKDYERKKKIGEEVSSLSGRAETLKKEIEKITKMGIDSKETARLIEEYGRKSDALNEEIGKLKIEERERAKRVGELEGSIATLSKKVIEKNRLEGELSKEKPEELKRIVEERTELSRKMADAVAKSRSRLEEEEKWKKELEKHLGACPICRRELDEALRKKLIVERDELIGRLGAEIKAGEAEKAKAEKELKEYAERYDKSVRIAERVKEYAGVEKEVDEARSEAEKERKEDNRLVSKIDERSRQLEAERNAYNDAKTKMEYVNRKNNYERELAEEAGRMEKLKREGEGIKVDEKRLYELQDMLTADSATLSDLKSKLEGEKKYLDSIVKQIDDKAKEIGRFEAMKAGIESRRFIVNDLNKFKSALVDTEALLRNNLVQSVNSILQSLWPKLYPYGDYTSLRLTAQRDDYVLEINAPKVGEDGWSEVDSVASGGERSITALALRVALSMVIVPNLRWMILDEPTHNLDRAGISKLIEVLGGALPSIVEQVFIITHDESLRDISSASVYVLDRDKAANGTTTVGGIS